MNSPSLRRLPDLTETPEPADIDVESALRVRFTERTLVPVDVVARVGAGAACIVVVAGTLDSAWELFAFARGDGVGLDGPLGAAVDAADQLVKDLDVRRPPLDWLGRPEKRFAVFVRGERRAYAVEEQASALLNELPLPRAIPGFPPPVG